MTRAVIILVLGAAAACGPYYRVHRSDGRSVQLGGPKEIAVCEASDSDVVATNDFGGPARCRVVETDARDWFATYEAVWVFEPRDCKTTCNALVELDLDTGEETVLLPDAQRREEVVALGRWIVWLDHRNDANGLCFFPAGDTDCAIDVYGYDRETKQEVRLTSRSTVEPNDGTTVPFGMDHDTLVYVDRERSPSGCYSGGVRTSTGAACPTDLVAVDLATRTETAVHASVTAIYVPRVAGEDFAWIEEIDDDLDVFAKSGAASPAYEVVSLEEGRAIALERGWLIARTESRSLEAVVLSTGEHVVIESKPINGFGTGDGRVVWRDYEEPSFSSYDLETRRTRFFLRY